MATAAAPFELEGAYAPPQSVTIASVYPVEQTVDISRRAPISKFTVPAGTKEKPGIFVVGDTWESEYTDSRGHRNIRILADKTAQHIVDGLTVHVFEANAAEQAYPGIFVCAGDAPTADEIENAVQCQRRYFMRLVNSAREKARNKRTQDIQDKERMAAQSLGLSGEEWMNDISKDSMKQCVWCSKHIPGAAKKCPEAGCGGFQKPEYAAEFAAMNAPPVVATSAVPSPPPSITPNQTNNSQQRR